VTDHVSIDWLSVTSKISALADDTSYDTARRILLQHAPPETGGHDHEPAYRPGFVVGVSWSHMIYMYLSRAGVILTEYTGMACATLGDDVMRDKAISADKITRIDIAHDLLTPTRPLDFVVGCEGGKTRAIATVISDTGETVYLGSKKSDRYCRVYRYDKKHPRRDYLRIEYVARGVQARAIVDAMRSGATTPAIAVSAGDRYAWIHEAYKRPTVASAGPIGHTYATRKDSKTVTWLYSQAAPAMARLAKAGVIDVSEFIAYVDKLKREIQGDDVVDLAGD
jgi:hypothetical protein